MTISGYNKVKNIDKYKDGLKYCPHCDSFLHPSLFYNQKTTSDKLSSWCKKCNNDNNNVHRRNNRARRWKIKEEFDKDMKRFLSG